MAPWLMVWVGSIRVASPEWTPASSTCSEMAWEITWPKEDKEELSGTYFNEAHCLTTPFILTDALSSNQVLCLVPAERSRN